MLGRLAALLSLLATGRALEVLLDVTNGKASPDSGPSREVILINGKLGGPRIDIREGDSLRVTLVNNMENPRYTEYFGATSVHWHGFGMDGIPYLDGTSYVSQCPLHRQGVQQIDFAVNEPSGTYFYHDHKSLLAADGLFGAIIVEGSEDARIREAYNVVDDVVLFVQDWFSADSVTQAKGLNQPFATGNETGPAYFTWIGAPRSLLFNFQGCASDCTPPTGNATDQTCSPDASCESRYMLSVLPSNNSSSVRVRMIGAGTLLYQIVCFEDHNVTLISTDARPVQPMVLDDGCVDINVGQRMDVIVQLKTPEELMASNTTQFWITGRGTGRTGMPASYGILSYANSTALPTTPAPQPGDVRPNWSEDDFQMKIKGIQAPEWVTSMQPANRTVYLDIGQPVIQQTNQLRWALSNAVYLKSPTCGMNILDAVSDPTFLSDANPNIVANGSAVQNVNIMDMPGLGPPGYGDDDAYIFLNLATNPALMPEQPVSGTPIVTTSNGQIIDIIIQDRGAGALGGVDLGRTNQEQHPMHLHGHHFYVIGSGQGDYQDLANDTNVLNDYLNWADPHLRDTETLPKNGWLYLRFRASNPGVWPFHCHIQAHEFMGMVLLFGEDVDNIPATPADVVPDCEASCTYSAKIYNTSELSVPPGLPPGLPPGRPTETPVPSPVPPGSRGTMPGWASSMLLLLVLAVP